MTEKIYEALGIKVVDSMFIANDSAHDSPRLNEKYIGRLRAALNEEKFGCLLNNLILIELFDARPLSPYDWSVDTLQRNVLRRSTTDTSFKYMLSSILPATIFNCLLVSFQKDYFDEALDIYCTIKRAKILEPEFIFKVMGSDVACCLSKFWTVQSNIMKFVDLMETHLPQVKEFRTLVENLKIPATNMSKVLMELNRK